jgi:hypothetical protein
MKSTFLKLSKSDYAQVFYEAVIGGITVYVIAITTGQAVFSLNSFIFAIGGAIGMGVRKALKLYTTNSKGEPFTKEPVHKATSKVVDTTFVD